jgi:hypothetical protein
MFVNKIIPRKQKTFEEHPLPRTVTLRKVLFPMAEKRKAGVLSPAL